MNSKIKSFKLQIIKAVFAVLLMVAASSIKSYASDGYVDISTKEGLERYIADKIIEHETTIKIDYNGEGYEDIIPWLKEYFSYDSLINYMDDKYAYDYRGTYYLYWKYPDKRRIKMDLSYYMTKEQGEVVDQWIDLYIEQCGLKNKTPYEAAKEVHDYIKATFTYDRDSYNIFESLISQKANGYVISMLNCLILNKLDIPTRITYGDHLWNSTQIDGVWYYTDIVWDMYDPKNSNFLVLPNVYNESRIATNGFIPTN